MDNIQNKLKILILVSQIGMLLFGMGPQPNTEWGTGTPPPSMSTIK